MFPNLLGFNDSSYIFFFLLGIIAAFLIAFFYLKKKNIKKSAILDMAICLCGAIVFGIIFALLFENLYEAIALQGNYRWVWKMTFFGGLFGGVGGFLLTYFIFMKKTALKINDLLIIAPCSITGAHSLGRFGCFLEGCCYGKPTDSWIGINFPGVGKVIPTQLIEAIFLLFLTIVLLILAFKYNFRYTFIVYIASYSVFRFIIEFFRGDDRGAFLGPFSPSQIFCFVLIAALIPIYIIINKSYEKESKKLS